MLRPQSLVMHASLRIAIVGAGLLLLQAACARSVNDGLDDDIGRLAPTSTLPPLAACIATECPAPWASCGDVLCGTDTSRDVNNCGGCGDACPKLQSSLHATPLCSNSACTFACDPYFADCNHAAFDGCEVSASDDPANCGGCGIACAAGDICWRGACGCPKGFTACGKECKNLQVDDEACGSCGNECKAPAANDTRWICGPGVQPYHTEWRCTEASCQIQCKGLSGDCNDDLCADGCETDLDDDPKNCGACGHACEANQECLQGACICPAGTTRCGNRCVDVAVDLDNCGACGNSCPGANDATSNGTPTCNGGHCGYTCYPGFADCNGRINDGCEVDVGKDPKNCGGCGTKCDQQLKQPCIGGVCLTKSCDPTGPTK